MNTYEITKISDILQLNEQQIDKFCSELPSCLKAIKAIIELSGTYEDIVKSEMLEPIKWIDDNKTDVTINSTVEIVDPKNL